VAEGIRDGYLERGSELLDSALEKFTQGMAALGMEELVLGLRQLRDEDGAHWSRFVEERCRTHPIARLLCEDPLTDRSLRKPYGYPGDPRMLDYIFAPDTVPAGTSPLGGMIFGYTTNGPAPRSVRARAALIARAIDTLAERKPIRVLSVMGGHLWEARLSRAARDGGVEKYLAFDQDARTLAAVDAMAHGPGVTTYQGTLRSLVRGRSVFRNFDLVYSGLCDNLPDTMASRFIGTLFDALAPGGRLLVSNFASDLVDAGYMEAFMGWRLFYRSEEEMAALSAHLPGERIARRTTYRDPHGNIVFLEIVRG
jgi:extracellular factor (EF) 3-hydroxypalmitic acid methyl ester biosynthesis protein